MRTPFALLLAGLCASSDALASDWYVDGRHPLCVTGNGTPERPFCRIVDAQRAARDGDTIYIAAGTYLENLVIDKDLRLVGARGPERTRIDGGCRDRVIDVPVPRIVVLEDLVVERGCANRGAGIRGLDATLHLVRTQVARNLFGNPLYGGTGGGIEIHGGALRLEACEVRDNLDSLGRYDTGSGISAYLASVEIRDSVITGNRSAGPCLVVSAGPFLVRGSTIAGNQGGGIAASHGPLTIQDSILWANAGTPLFFSGTTPPAVSWSTIEGGWPGTGNLASDPLFVDLGSGDLHLRSDSPCVDSTDPRVAPSGTDLVGAPRFLDGDLDGCMIRDRGAYEFAHVELAVAGQLAAGGSITLAAQGPPGGIAALFFAARSGEHWLPPYGALLFDPAGGALLLESAALPFARSLCVPLETPPWLEGYLQLVALDPGSNRAECSNAVALTTR
jgi:hypothetical protein